MIILKPGSIQCILINFMHTASILLLRIDLVLPYLHEICLGKWGTRYLPSCAETEIFRDHKVNTMVADLLFPLQGLQYRLNGHCLPYRRISTNFTISPGHKCHKWALPVQDNDRGKVHLTYLLLPRACSEGLVCLIVKQNIGSPIAKQSMGKHI